MIISVWTDLFISMWAHVYVFKLLAIIQFDYLGHDWALRDSSFVPHIHWPVPASCLV